MHSFTVSPEAAAPEAPAPEPVMPEKFAKAADPQKALLQAYLEAERKLGTSKAVTPENSGGPAPEETTAEETAPEEVTPEDAEQAAAEGHLPENLRPFSEEFAEKGELSEESYAKLAEMGFSKEVVDTYVSAVKGDPVTQEQEVALIESAGGSEAFEAIVGWARENLSEDDLSRYNAAVVKGATAEMAIAWLRQKHADAEGVPPTLVSGTTSRGQSAVQGYRSQAEMRRDMKDPRYKTDQAYRDDVARKLAATTAF